MVVLLQSERIKQILSTYKGGLTVIWQLSLSPDINLIRLNKFSNIWKRGKGSIHKILSAENALLYVYVLYVKRSL